MCVVIAFFVGVGMRHGAVGMTEMAARFGERLCCVGTGLPGVGLRDAARQTLRAQERDHQSDDKEA